MVFSTNASFFLYERFIIVGDAWPLDEYFVSFWFPRELYNPNSGRH